MSMTPGSAPPPAAPILIGVLYDFPQADGGASVEEAIRLGLAEVAKSGRIDREFGCVVIVRPDQFPYAAAGRTRC